MSLITTYLIIYGFVAFCANLFETRSPVKKSTLFDEDVQSHPISLR
jgi:hypothetical protein